MSRVDAEFGLQLPDFRVPPPGPASKALMTRLARVESRNITYSNDAWPVFWEAAAGANVRDVDGNVFIDLTGAFGVGLLGHGHPAVRAAIAEQSQRLLHGMGDIHPPAKKLELLERLAEISPWDDARIVLSTTGSEAVETGLKTARLASGRPGILAFEGGYHGLTLGSLAATERDHFRGPFEDRVYGGVAFAPFPDPLRDAEPTGSASLARVVEILEAGAPNGDPIGTIVVEPVQARGGARIPPAAFMSSLSELARERGVLVVADEVMTGLGRCGAMFASGLVGLDPDVICIGKALGGGLPISACIAPRRVMDSWPASGGEAIHTSTFLGHPLACATALAVLDTLSAERIPARVREAGAALLAALTSRLKDVSGVADVRGVGLLLGVELVSDGALSPDVGAGGRAARAALARGLIVLPAGDVGHVVELTPAMTLTTEQSDFVVETLAEVLEGIAR